ncbi:lysozyme inhibitor LprI family protein [Luteimonas sp. Y-2-2-4F]|nr:lysozyme inhibitor LprI family protein [Luteimonas sp. Y-2-2-4F]MCD9031539.1 lysozyme inhibitor LprI family protein [Luteimonas sp. Y-2-2-4F]
MRGVRSLLLSLGLLPCALAAAAGDPDAVCRDWLRVPVPAADAGAAPAGCDAGVLYYGTDGRGGDPVAARHCAYRERAEDGRPVPEGKVFGGSGVLAMLYANGRGVERDIPLASRFACEHGGAPAEVRGRLDHLQRIADGRDDAPFDLCDDITSGMMSGMCAGLEARFARHARDLRWQALQADWTPAQREAWSALESAAEGYFRQASQEEQDMSGTARGMFAVGAREELEIALLEDVGRFERGERPRQAAGDFAAADRALNAAYREVLGRLRAGARTHGLGDYGTVSADGVRDVQREWLRYREAWVDFAAARWPDTAADAWRAWLSESRTAALRAVVGDPQ